MTVINPLLKSLIQMPDFNVLSEILYQETGKKLDLKSTPIILHLAGQNLDPASAGDSGIEFMDFPEDQNEDVSPYESLLNSNSIDSVYYHEPNFSGQARVWGQTIDSEGKFSDIFHQDVTLNGTSGASLSTPLARILKAENIGTEDWVGGIVFHESGVSFDSDGRPDDADKVHLQNKIDFTDGVAFNQASKTSFAVPNNYIFLIYRVSGAICASAGNSYIDGEIQTSQALSSEKRIFKTQNVFANGNAANISKDLFMYKFVDSNKDVRLSAHINNTSSFLKSHLSGLLLKVVS